MYYNSKSLSKKMLRLFLLLMFIMFLTGVTFSQEKNKRSDDMKRQEIYKEIEHTLGLVPTFFKLVPDRSLELEWNLFKTLQLEDSPIPHKYRELIGVGISAVTKCRYCSYFHTEVAKLFGATDEEIEDAVHYAKSSAGWSAYLNGMQVDYDQFKNELDQSIKYIKAQMKK
uniref:Carboxymuconolactone decarboxylase family protein n=1 Tax=Ignavibacterium album TaxID=591197 RepID=A0A832LJR8_9BACT